MNHPTERSVPVLLRMPESLHAWIHGQAKADRRSAHSLILLILERAKEQSHATS